MSKALLQLHEDYVNSLISLRSSRIAWSKKHIEINGYFWCINAMHLLNRKLVSDSWSVWLVPFVMSCRNHDGGFSSSLGCDSSIAATLCALQILVLLGERDLLTSIREATLEYLSSLYQSTGCFLSDKFGESDVQYTYSALYCLRILDGLQYGYDTHAIASSIRSCLNWDGAFGNSPGSESHAGSTYCCLASLRMINRLDCVLTKDEKDAVAEWLSQRQNNDGGLCGRPNKKSDACYSWWVFSSLGILGKSSWTNESEVASYIYKCEGIRGGFADQPGKSPDPFHTFFSLAGLSILHEHTQSFNTVTLQPLSLISALPKAIDDMFPLCIE